MHQSHLLSLTLHYITTVNITNVCFYLTLNDVFIITHLCVHCFLVYYMCICYIVK